MKGVLLVDKPAGLTSHDVVDRVRRAAGTRRVGHTGTLDPAATGLLILCIGPATRLSEFLIGMDKVYEGVMRLGVVTDSYDLDGVVLEEHPVPELSATAIQQVCNQFTGDIQQIPPMVSAVKIGGERLYKKARKGEVVERAPRNVTVREFSVLHYASPDADFVLRCTSGTYARALCHDVGALLGCGGVLARLRRTSVGPHSVENAVALDALTSPTDVVSRLISMENVLELPVAVVRSSAKGLALSGGTLDVRHLMEPSPVSTGWVQLKDEQGILIALAEAKMGGRLQPKRVLDEA